MGRKTTNKLEKTGEIIVNIQKKRKGIISLFAFVLFAIVIAVFVILQTGAMTAFATEQEANTLAIRYDASIKELAHLATIEENFEDDKVIVILDHQKSRINGAVSLNDFSALAEDIEFVSIKDEFRITDVKKYQKSNTNFRQILSLTLKESGKENVIKAVKELEKIDGVLLAQPEYIYGIQDDWSPNDTSYGQQWALTATHGIQAENTWNLVRGNNGVTVGIMENGIRVNHPDLTVVDGNFTPATGFTAGHGTHVAGIIAAIGNNNRGITGVSQSQISVLSRANLRTTLEWAQNNNIRAINASYYYTRVVSGATVPALPDANHATAIQNYDGLFVSSAGNSGRTNLGNTDNTPQYPSGYGDARNYPNINNVLSVGSLNNVTTTNAQRSDFSCFGTNSVHIYAPGGNILSTFPDDLCDGTIHAASGFRNCEEPVLSGGVWFRSHTHQANGYHLMSGTSMAAPQVTGVAALLLSVNPDLTPVQLRDAILNNADSVTIQIPNPAGGTTFENQTVLRLNAFRAVSAVAFTSSPVSGGISITGFRTGFTLPNNTDLVLPNAFTPLNYMVSTPNHSTSYTNGFYTERSLDINLIASVTYTLQFDYTGFTSSIARTNVFTSLGVGASSYASDLSVTQNFANTETGRQTITFTPTASQLSASSKLWVRFIRTSTQQTVSINIRNIILRGDYQVTAIGNSAFSGCTQLSQITIPASVTSIGLNAFMNSGIWKNTQIGDVVYAGNWAVGYKWPMAGDLVLKPGTVGISDSAFNNSAIKRAVIPDSVKVLGKSAFFWCSKLESVVIPDGITEIAKDTFYNCSSLTEITIPATVTNIGATAFENCSSLVTVQIERASSAGITTLGSSAFLGCSKLSTIHVPDNASVTAYSTALNWSAYRSLFTCKTGYRLFGIAGVGGEVAWTAYPDNTVIIEGYLNPENEYAWWFADFTFTDFEIIYIDDDDCEVRMINDYALLFEASYSVNFVIKLTGVNMSAGAEIIEINGVASTGYFGGIVWTAFSDGTAFLDCYFSFNGSIGLSFYNFSFEDLEVAWINNGDCIIYMEEDMIMFETDYFADIKCVIKLTGVNMLF